MVVALSPPRRADPGSVKSPRGSVPPPEGSHQSAVLSRLKQNRKLLVRVAAGALVTVGLIGAIGTRVFGGSSTSSANKLSVVSQLPRVAAGKSTTGEPAPAAPKEAAPTQGEPVPAVIAPPGTKGVAIIEVVAPTTVAKPLVVHAAGAVAVPGVYVFAPGARVADLVSAAGGTSPDADTDRLNLAAVLTDGSRVFVPRRGQLVPPILAIDLDIASSTDTSSGVGVAGKVSTDGVPVAKVNLNTATLDQLDALPGVGPATATAIIEHRTKIGRFRSVTQLMDIPGIGEAKFAALRPRVTV